MNETKTAKTVLYSILFLFYLQVLSDFIEAIYAFGLLVTSFTVEVTAVVLLFTPLLLLLFRKPPARSLLLVVAYLGVLARLMEPLLDPGGKLVVSGISVGAFMLLFPILLHRHRSMSGWQAGSGLTLALSISIFLRTANSSLDLSETGIYQAIGWALGVLAGFLLFKLEPAQFSQKVDADQTTKRQVTGLSIGLASVILIIYFAFVSPTVIARWTGYSYPTIVLLLVIALTLFSISLGSHRLLSFLTRRVVLALNIFFVLMVVLTILPHQIAFPSQSNFYPLVAPAVSAIAPVLMFLMLVLSPIVIIDFMLFTRQIVMEKPSLPQLGRSFSTAALFFLLMVFFHVFTTVYDYVPVIGPLFRDRFWLVYLLAGLGLIFPLLLIRKETFGLESPDITKSFATILPGVFAVLTGIALYSTTPSLPSPNNTTQLRVMTYNIQQGFDVNGNKNLEAQLAVFRKVDPDVLGLQESDTARIANGNVNAVRYFADNLNMYSYYGPTTTTGTFGIALLSKYPIQDPVTFYMYSTGEQTATIHAKIAFADKEYHIFVTHLGNGGPIFQLENMLTRIKGLDRVIAVGDFNFRPATEQYSLMTQTLADSWLIKWPAGREIQGMSSDDRIDYIFVSPGTNILESEYGVDPASDHPFLYSTIKP